MSETITGTLEEIAIVKTGKGAKGQWTLRKITVDGEKYSTFDPVKATIGSTVQFDWVENDKGYKDVVKGSFQVTEEATPAKTSATKTQVGAGEASRQDSIERQTLLKCAVELAAVEGGIDAVSGYFDTLKTLLHPSVKTAKAASKSKPPTHEDDNQDAPDY